MIASKIEFLSSVKDKLGILDLESLFFAAFSIALCIFDQNFQS
jgi:hypothetical protein